LTTKNFGKNIWSKIENFGQNRNFGQKSNFWSKIEILLRNPTFGNFGKNI